MQKQSGLEVEANRGLLPLSEPALLETIDLEQICRDAVLAARSHAESKGIGDRRGMR